MYLLRHKNNWSPPSLSVSRSSAIRPWPSSVAGARSSSTNGAEASDKGACEGLSGAAFGLCNAYCNAQHCDVNPTATRATSYVATSRSRLEARRFPAIRRSHADFDGDANGKQHRGSDRDRHSRADGYRHEHPHATETWPYRLGRPRTRRPRQTPRSRRRPIRILRSRRPPTRRPQLPTDTLAVRRAPPRRPQPTRRSLPRPIRNSEPTAPYTPTATPTDTLAVPTGTASATQPHADHRDRYEYSGTDIHRYADRDADGDLGGSTGTAEATATDTPNRPQPILRAVDIDSDRHTTPPNSPPLSDDAGRLHEHPDGGRNARGGRSDAVPLPPGGTIVQHVSAATGRPVSTTRSCLSPAASARRSSAFSRPQLQRAGHQDGCGVGRIDSNGGSDFTISEVGDTSSPTVCGLPASNCATPPGDSNVQVDITVGNGVADTCGSGTANAAVVVPVHTVTWSHVPLINCNASGPDTTGPGGTGDTTVVEFDQNLDFTTDSTSADWSDLDIDGAVWRAPFRPARSLCACRRRRPGGPRSHGYLHRPGGHQRRRRGRPRRWPQVRIGSNGAPLFRHHVLDHAAERRDRTYGSANGDLRGRAGDQLRRPRDALHPVVRASSIAMEAPRSRSPRGLLFCVTGRMEISVFRTHSCNETLPETLALHHLHGSSLNSRVG